MIPNDPCAEFEAKRISGCVGLGRYTTTKCFEPVEILKRERAGGHVIELVKGTGGMYGVRVDCEYVEIPSDRSYSKEYFDFLVEYYRNMRRLNELNA